MGKKLQKYLDEAEKTEQQIAELEERLRTIRAAQKRKRTARSFVPSAAPRWEGANCWLCWTTFKRAT